MNIKEIQTWDERSVPRLTCVLGNQTVTLTINFTFEILNETPL
jgi:hypothetical protein